MAPPSDSASREAALRNQKKGAPFKFLFPLVYAPVLPLIRLSLRHRPVLRDRLFTAVLAGAFAHGFYLVIIPWLHTKPDVTLSWRFLNRSVRHRKQVRAMNMDDTFMPLDT